MRDQGKPYSSSDKDVLKETLRSLQDLVREVDEISAPVEIERRDQTTPPEPEPVVAPAPEPKPVAQETTPTPEPAALAPEPEPEPESQPAAADDDEPMIEWYSSLTEPSSAHKPHPTRRPHSPPDDVPLLREVAILPGHRHRARSNKTGAQQQDLLDTAAPTARFEPTVITEVTDKTISFLEEKLSEASGQPLDHDTRVHLRQQIYAALQRWVTSTQRRLHGIKK